MKSISSTKAKLLILAFFFGPAANAQTASQAMNSPGYRNSHQPAPSDESTTSAHEVDGLLGAPSEPLDYANNPLASPVTQGTSTNSVNSVSGQNKKPAVGNSPMTSFTTNQIDPYANLSFIDDGSDDQLDKQGFEPWQAPHPTLTSKHPVPRVKTLRAYYKKSASIYTSPW